MNATDARQLLITIASEDVGKRELTSNRAPWIAKLWPLTSYPEGYAERAPYCSAGMCYVLAEFIRRLAEMGELKKTLGKSLAEANKWRCKDAGAWNWMAWAKKKGVATFPDSEIPLHGDFVVFDFHHIGLVVNYDARSDTIATVEFNTNAGGGREGDGCMSKSRRRKDAQQFIRILP